jgi:hypothetical protein
MTAAQLIAIYNEAYLKAYAPLIPAGFGPDANLAAVEIYHSFIEQLKERK